MAILNTFTRYLYEPESEIFSQSQFQSNFAIPKKLAHEAMIQNISCRIFTPDDIESYQSLIKPTRTTYYILISTTTPLVDFLWPQLTTKYKPTPIFILAGGNKA